MTYHIETLYRVVQTTDDGEKYILSEHSSNSEALASMDKQKVMDTLQATVSTRGATE